MLSWIKSRLPHFLFSFALAALSSLMIWWVIFIHRSIEEQHQAKVNLLLLRTRLMAEQLGRAATKPRLGPLQADEGIIIALAATEQKEEEKNQLGPLTTSSLPQNLIFPLLPNWKDLVIHPAPRLIKDLERKHASLRLMLVGEASVIVLVVLICLFFLYQYVQLEKRTAREINTFWEKAAHEIKTPLSGIKLLLQAINKEIKEEKLTPLLTLAQDRISQLEISTENILRHSYQQVKKIKLNYQKINLSDFIKKYFHSSLLPPGTQIELDFSLAAEAKVTVDPGALRVIFDNIVDNAVKFSPTPLKLRVWLAEDRRHVVVNLQDFGPGISKKEKKKIFREKKESYFQEEKSTGQIRGAGVGLFIAHNLAKKMKGKLDAFSQGKGQGTIFSLFLRK